MCYAVDCAQLGRLVHSYIQNLLFEDFLSSASLRSESPQQVQAPLVSDYRRSSRPMSAHACTTVIECECVQRP